MTSPMTPQLEKIARALARDWAESCAVIDVDDFERECWLRFRPPARAALSALLPPSEEMVQAMRDNVHEAINADSLSYAFTAVIQSILSEGAK